MSPASRSPPAATAHVEPLAADAAAGLPFRLRLYVSGATPASSRAVVNARRFCETHLAGRYSLEILSIVQHVAEAALDEVVAAPTLIKLAPLPVRRFIGDLTDTRRLEESLAADSIGLAAPFE